tara:strand:+ start:1150 stop:2067 length:918 start_codon:yes stop_codon:yes gene_type:complete
MKQVLDVHVFYGPNPILRKEYTLDMIKEHHQKLKDQEIDARFLIMATMPIVNDQLEEVYKELEGIAVGVVPQINPNPNPPFPEFYPTTPSEDIWRLAEKDHVVAFKLIPPYTDFAIDDPRLAPYTGAFEKNKTPLMIHGSADRKNLKNWDTPERVQRFLYNPENQWRYNGKLVLVHAGGLREDKIRAYMEMADHRDADGNSQLALEISGFSGEDSGYDSTAGAEDADVSKRAESTDPDKFLGITKELVAKIPNKVIFGSDWPELDWTLHPLSKLHEQGDINNQQLEDILWNNAVNFFDKLAYLRK